MEIWFLHLFDVLVGTVIVGGLALGLRRLVMGPSDATRQQIALALKAKHLELVDVTTSWRVQFGASSRLVLVAKCRNIFGNTQTEYFEVDFWAEALGRSRVRELGNHLSPLRRWS
jgi:hypothetical protein